MRIAIDARAAAEVPAGRGRYVRELLRATRARERAARVPAVRPHARGRQGELDARFRWITPRAPGPQLAARGRRRDVPAGRRRPGLHQLRDDAPLAHPRRRDGVGLRPVRARAATAPRQPARARDAARGDPPRLVLRGDLRGHQAGADAALPRAVRAHDRRPPRGRRALPAAVPSRATPSGSRGSASAAPTCWSPARSSRARTCRV